jgi:hypothetical protein
MKALFVCYGGGHVSMVLPVVRDLRALLPGVGCELLALTNGFARAVKAGEHPMGYRDFLKLVNSDLALEWGRRLLPANSSPDVSEEESLAYLGINYLDLIAQFGEDEAARRYSEHGRYAFKPLHFMRLLFDEIRPDVVVATNSPRSEQAALEVAVEREIPSVGMVDLFGLDSDPYVSRPVKPDVTCVLADSVRDRLLARCFAPEGVRVTGNPAFDGLFDASNLNRAHEFLDSQGWRGRKVILYIGAWEPVDHPATEIGAGRVFPVEIEGILRRYVRERPDTALVVRYHPGDWFHYPRQPDEPQVHFSEPPSEPIHPLVLASTIVVTTNSTVGLEAAVAGKPVVSIENSPSVHHWFSLASLGVSYPSPTHHDLAATIDAVLVDPRPLRAFQSDGCSARRVAQVVAEAGAGGFRRK